MKRISRGSAVVWPDTPNADAVLPSTPEAAQDPKTVNTFPSKLRVPFNGPSPTSRSRASEWSALASFHDIFISSCFRLGRLKGIRRRRDKNSSVWVFGERVLLVLNVNARTASHSHHLFA